MSVREAQSRIDSAEFAEWIAFNNLEPIGEERGDRRAAVIAQTVANAHAQGRHHFQLDDFMLRYGPPKKQTAAEMKAILMQVSNQGAKRAADRKAIEKRRAEKKSAPAKAKR